MTALITGASGGIGYEVARLLAAQGYDLILVARSAEKLEQLKLETGQTHQIKALVIAQDLTYPQAADNIYNEIREKNIMVDLLINNAGFGLMGRFAKTDFEVEKNMIQLNITALTHMTKRFLPDMLKRKSGTILNIASTAAFLPGPLMSVYYASKAYVQSFSAALATELKGTGVKVISFCPGPTESGFAATAKLEQARIFKSGLYKVMSAKDVARDAVKALDKNKATVISGFMNKVMMQSLRFTPRFLAPRLVMWLNKHREK